MSKRNQHMFIFQSVGIQITHKKQRDSHFAIIVLPLSRLPVDSFLNTSVLHVRSFPSRLLNLGSYPFVLFSSSDINYNCVAYQNASVLIQSIRLMLQTSKPLNFHPILSSKISSPLHLYEELNSEQFISELVITSKYFLKVS